MSPQRTSTTMELLPLVCLCLLSCSGDAVRVVVEEGSDAVLPCLISNKGSLTGNRFVWKKDDQKEVFTYDANTYSGMGGPSQDEQFKGRVSHFQDQLKNGNASIKITRTKVDDSGIYSCDFPRLQSQTFYIELVVDPRVRVVVKEDSDAFLPCSPNPKVNLTGHVFDWKKDGQKEKKEVFLYNSGGHTTQGPDFTDRVKHFQDQLKNGSASIKIHRIKKTDSGIYSCHFPDLEPSQTFYMKLVVDPDLKDRTGENIPGASKPYVTTLMTDDGKVLQCEVLGASPKPKVEWKDGSGNKLPVKNLKETKRGDRYDIILQAAFTKPDTFRCVVTQEEISHQSYAELDLIINGLSDGWIAFIGVSLLLVAAVVGGGWCYKKKKDKKIKRLKLQIAKSEEPQEQPDSKSEKKSDGEKTDPAQPLNPPEKNPGSTPNAANGQPDTEENTAV